MQALAGAFPAVSFVAVAIKGERGPLLALMRKRGLSQRAGRLRQRRDTRQPVQGRELSAGVVRAAGRHRAEPGAARHALAAGRCVRAWPSWWRRRTRGAGRPAGMTVEQAPKIGWRAREIAEELPQLRIVVCARAPRAGGRREARLSAGHRAAAARSFQPLPGSARGRRAPRTRPLRVQGVLPPDRPRPGGRADADRGGGVGAHAARRLPLRGPAPGCLADRPHRYRRAGLGARCAGRPRGARRATQSGERAAREGLRRAGRCPREGSWWRTRKSALGLLFGEFAGDCEPGGRTREITLFAVQVAGVPTLYVEEALWSCRHGLEAAR